jgi:peptide/nickel transport system substrate-binding protein
MDEHALRETVHDVKSGRLGRRRFIETMVGLGLTAPLAAQMLGAAGVATAQPTAPAFVPKRRGGGGEVRVLYWQAPTLLNPHMAAGTKDYAGARVFYEPLAGFDIEGNLVPVLAAEVPSVQNGGLAKDGMSVTWRLKKGVVWHDGAPFTADDVVFNWEYAADPATAATSLGTYRDIERVEKVNDLAVKVVFKKPTPFWCQAFCGGLGMLIPKHLFAAFKGARSREAPQNLKAVGTGPYRYVDFKPGDTIRAELFPGYHAPNRPFFDTFEMKGGGDAASAARAVLQTGEYDLAWNMQVEDEILRRMEQRGKGRVVVFQGNGPEIIVLNQADPWKEVDGERASVKTVHPFLTDPAVRSALALLVDRGSIQAEIYGRLAEASANFLNVPNRFRSPNLKWEFSLEKASQTLEAGGWKRGPDGVRVKDGKRLKMLFQTPINAPRQKAQQIIKQAATKVGIELELKGVLSSVFFSTDMANTDTYHHFYADLEMYQTIMTQPDPQAFMEQYASWAIASKENKWASVNVSRWRNDEYDRLWRAAENEMDPVKRAGLFIRMNDLVVQGGVVVPLLLRNGATAVSKTLQGVELSTWDSNVWNLANWYRA